MKKNKLYIMNAANMPSDAIYVRKLITEEEFKALVTGSECIVSSIGYEEVSKHIEQVTGVKIPVNRGITELSEDEGTIVVCRLKFRPDPYLKGKIKAVPGDYEYIQVEYVKLTKSVSKWETKC